ncbi:hypothetical protein FRX31_032830 [Thalictrum thalictroides]|uniref:DUF4283 domain-containing protein n=1 Tax=Thalictrum thalictroides TaxID=46969 RepID=A0A7J6UY75_THATH|nr:hypothetical protein FRX31_032830 [Thalictrum thalictroides]
MYEERREMWGGMRRRSYAQVGGKSLEFEVLNNGNGFQTVEMIERGKGGVFRIEISEECTRWFSQVLCQASNIQGNVWKDWRFPDERFPVLVSARSNRWGEVLKFSMTLGRGGTRPKYKMLCFPTGEEKKGWAKVGEKLAFFVQAQERKEPKGPHLRERQNGVQKRNMITNIEVGNATPVRVEINSKGLVMNGEEWTKMVICATTDKGVDWCWVKEQILRKFRGVRMSFLDNGEAIVDMGNVREAEQIAALPPLWTEGWVVTFRRWRPMEGSLNRESDRMEDFWIRFKGIPLQLRNKQVVESLTKTCGILIQIDDSSLIFGCSTQRVKIKGGGSRPLPRSIWLEEKAYEFLITVTLEGNKEWEEESGERPIQNFTQRDDDVERSAVRGTVQREDQFDRFPTYAQVTASPSLNRPPGFEQVRIQHKSPSQAKQTQGEGACDHGPNMGMLNRGSDSNGLKIIESRSVVMETPITTGMDQCFDSREAPSGDRSESVRPNGKIHSKLAKNFFWANKSQRWPNWAKNNVRKNNRRSLRRGKSKERSAIEEMVSPMLLSGKGKGIQFEGGRRMVLLKRDQVGEVAVCSTEVREDCLQETTSTSSIKGQNTQVFSDGEVVVSTPLRDEVMQKLKDSLLNCSSDEQMEEWIKRLVLPLSSQLGVEAVGEAEKLEALYRELCQQNEKMKTQNDGLFGDYPMDDPDAEGGEGGMT